MPSPQFLTFIGATRTRAGAVVTAAVLAVMTVAASYAWQGKVGLNLADEGYLWYGVQRVMAGDVPLRDFQSYEPGRYYWSATWMHIFGLEGIADLRAVVTAFAVIGLFLTLVLVARHAPDRSWVFLAAACVTTFAWMYPPHKLFDAVASIALVCAAFLLVRHRRVRDWFFAGVMIGLAAVLGRNHGVYGMTGAIIATAYVLTFPGTRRAILLRYLPVGVLGVVVGFLPVIAMALFVDGFASAFWESVIYPLELGATNVTLPVPWPWNNGSGLDAYDLVRAKLVGTLFLLLLVVGIGALVAVFFNRLRWQRQVPPLIVAAAFMILPYAHFAFSRADVPHLAQGFLPFVIFVVALLAIAPPLLRWSGIVLLLASSIWVMLPMQPAWMCREVACHTVELGRDELRVDEGTASTIALLRRLDMQYGNGDRPFAVFPFTPGAYAVLERRSPVWEIYPLLPRSESFQRREMHALDAADPAFVLLNDAPLDGRDELRFTRTHPVFIKHVRDSYERADGIVAAPFELYVRP